MYEKHGEQVVSMNEFIKRVLKSIVICAFAAMVALGIGVVGYHEFEQMSWLDAFLNASMILSNMGPVSKLYTTGGKLFAGCYALFSGLVFIFIIGVLLTPIIHRILHEFHDKK